MHLLIALIAANTVTLPNGLKVRIERQPRAVGVVGLAVAYEVGARHDPKGYAGMAHLVEHLAFRRTKHLQDGEPWTTLAALGGAGR